MSRLEKRLIAAALVFVLVYLGAVAVTVHHRMTTDRESELKFESAEPLREERHLMMAELLLPMLILLAVAVSFILVKKKRQKVAARMDEEHEDDVGEEWREPEKAEEGKDKANA
jgi:NADH:ubiquinone oxidoreductase subunit 6 (subunit J)